MLCHEGTSQSISLKKKKKDSKKFPDGLVVKDSGLSLLWLRFDLRPRKFHMPSAQPQKEKKKKDSKTETLIFVEFWKGVHRC